MQDWIKMRIRLSDDLAVISIAAALKIDSDLVVGKLHKIWGWANENCNANGNAPSVTDAWIDRYVNMPGFARAMERAGWLTITDDGVVFPRFARHNSQSAKHRAVTANRVAHHRETCNASSVTDALRTASPEKRREEKNTYPLTPKRGRRSPKRGRSKTPSSLAFTPPFHGR